MKKFLINLILVLPILMSSCADFLDRYPTDSLSPATFLADRGRRLPGNGGLLQQARTDLRGLQHDVLGHGFRQPVQLFQLEGYKLLANGNAQTAM